MCVCAHPVQSSAVCVPPTTDTRLYRLKAIKLYLYKSFKNFTWWIYALSERLLVISKTETACVRTDGREQRHKCDVVVVVVGVVLCVEEFARWQHVLYTQHVTG